MFTLKTARHPTLDIASPLVVLNTESTSHYFGQCAEGTQRSLNEIGIRPAKMKNFFLTGLIDWNAIGGLPGLLLTLGDTGKANVMVHYGSQILQYVVATWRGFVYRQGIDVTMNSITDGAVVVEKYFLAKQVHSHPLVVTDSSVGAVASTLSVLVGKMFPKLGQAGAVSDPSSNLPYVNTELPAVDNTTHSSSYIIQFHQTRGKFSVERANKLKIPKGPLYAALSQGRSVEVNGVAITPDQVLLSPRKFKRILVISVPSSAYVTSTVSNPAWTQPIHPESDDTVGLVYHFLGLSVEFTPEYLLFIDSFGDKCLHVVSHPRYCPNTLNFKAAASVLLKLRSLQRDFFSLPHHANEAERDLGALGRANVIPLLTHQEITISPETIVIDDSRVVENFTNWDSLYDSVVAPTGISQYPKQEVLGPASPVEGMVEHLQDEVEVVTLGTGSALPSKTRNVIATLVRVPKPVELPVSRIDLAYTSVLLDAGEHTLGAMQRLYGPDLPRRLRELRLVYLSHLHADHHLGIITIVKEWFKVHQESEEKLFLVCPWGYEKFVREWSCLEPEMALDRITYISCEDFLAEPRSPEYASVAFALVEGGHHGPMKRWMPDPHTAAIQQMYDVMGLRSVAVCRAVHCQWAYSVVMDFALGDNSFKLSYSGDTRPNIRFATLGRGSDLLLHEATLEDALIEDALSKRHSTIAEALYTARLMQLRKLILTHFSQRYPELPDLTATECSFEHLRHYLNDPNSTATPLRANNTANIFSFAVDALAPPLALMDYLYAFDSMAVPYGRIHEQKAVASKLPAAFADDEPEGAKLEKLNKKEKRQKEKGTEMRLAREAQKLKKQKRRASVVEP